MERDSCGMEFDWLSMDAKYYQQKRTERQDARSNGQQRTTQLPFTPITTTPFTTISTTVLSRIMVS